MKISKPEFARTYVYNMLFIIIIIVVILDSLWVYQAYKDLDEKIVEMRYNYTEEQRKLIRNEVIRIADYIDFCKNKVTIQEKSVLSTRVVDLYNGIKRNYEENSNLSEKEIKTKALSLIYSNSYNDSQYYTLAFTLNNGLIKFDKESKKFLEKNKYFKVNAEIIREFIENNKKINELSKNYLWHVQGGGAYDEISSTKLDYIKLGAIKYFKPLDIFIVVGAYSSKITQKIQNDILDWIDTLTFPSNQYFFIDKYDGTPLIFDGRKVRENTISAPQEAIKSYKEEAERIINGSGNGYIYYPLPSKKGKDVYHKISFIETLDDWNWIVGAGFYMEDIENEISIMRQELEIKTVYNICEIVLIMFGFIIISMLIARYIIKKAENSFNSFFDFFEQSTLNSAMIDPEAQSYKEFEMLAHSANSMSIKRLQAEEAQRYSETRFKDIAESMADWIWEIDENLKYKYVSGKIVKILGHNCDEFLGKDYSELLKDSDDTSRTYFIELINKKEKIVDLNIWINSKKGVKICLQTSAIPFYNIDGSFAGYRGVSKDITQKIEALNELKRHKENLEFLVESRTRELAEKQSQLVHSSRLAALGEMAAGMAHEINQPLSTIKFVLDNMEIAISEGQFDIEYLKKKSKKVNLAIDKISNIINHVRVFSREQVPGSDKNEKIKIIDSINNAVQLINQQFKNNNIELSINNISSNLTTYGDVYKLEQVMINLMSNAKDAVLEKKSLNPADKNYNMRIEINAVKINNTIEIIIKDNGVGIKAEYLDKVLNPFFTTKDAGKGTGLGLSISYGIIQEMNGSIKFYSDDNGTKAVVNLPFVC